ncbi:MAG: hypothetical protein RLZZ84_98 [Pseudomonadota bacterium]|jgi:Ca2+-binding EF-hand superfamily protein
MKKILIGISLAALATAGVTAGVAIAQDHGPEMGMNMTKGMDPMGDKTMTRAEVQAKAEAHFAAMDVNKDGKLDAADRAAHMGQKFDQLDTDKNGAISRDEFADAHKGGHDKDDHGMNEHRMGGAMMMLKMADTNKDGAISKDEFVAAHLKMFDMADTDHDGKLTPAERKAAHAKMRDHMRGMHHDMNDDMDKGMNHGDHAMPPPPPPGA